MTMHNNLIQTARALCLTALVALMAASCATKKKLTEGTTGNNGGVAAQQQQPAKAEEAENAALKTIRQLIDNAVTTRNITSKIDFAVKMGSKDIAVDGSIYMRRDEVIRIQLAPMGLIEVARIEFTPSYVLIVDRVHKEYIKEDYRQVAFLSNNGVDFNALQSLFWNQLFYPGSATIGEAQMAKYQVKSAAGGTQIDLKQGDIALKWLAQTASGLIQSAAAEYASKQHGTSKLSWSYADFRALEGKQFPAQQTLQFNTTATTKKKEVTVTIKMNKLRTNGDWEAQTTVSKKYKKVTVEDVFNKIMNM